MGEQMFGGDLAIDGVEVVHGGVEGLKCCSVKAVRVLTCL
jgi:hypothetical protein